MISSVLTGTAGAQTPTCNGLDATIVGTSGSDRIYGTDGNDVIVALGGVDIIRSGDGNDTICGGEGRDRVYSGRGADTILGEEGNDRILGQAGTDTIFGGPGRDTILGGGGNDSIAAGGGNDKRIEGGPGTDIINGGSGNDRCDVPAEDTIKRCEYNIDGVVLDGGGNNDNGGNADPDLVQLYATINDSIVANYGPNNTWIIDAWNYIDANGTVGVDQQFPGGYVQTSCQTTSFQTFTTCVAVSMNIGVNAMVADVIIHELAHVYERTTDLPGNRSALSIALLYLEETYPNSTCPAPELIADAMLYSAKPNAYLSYWQGCGGVPSAPTAADMTVINTALAGNDPAWFASTYANGAQAWSAIVASPDKYELAGALNEFFGGYCSTQHTNEVLFGYTTDNNPYADGGC